MRYLVVLSVFAWSCGTTSAVEVSRASQWTIAKKGYPSLLIKVGETVKTEGDALQVAASLTELSIRHAGYTSSKVAPAITVTASELKVEDVTFPDNKALHKKDEQGKVVALIFRVNAENLKAVTSAAQLLDLLKTKGGYTYEKIPDDRASLGIVQVSVR